MARKTDTTEVPRTLWDFSRCPKDEVSFCATYEYLRQVAIVHRKRFEAKKTGYKWTPLVFAEVFKGYTKDGKRVEFKELSKGMADPFEISLAVKQTFALAACHCSGFPDAPYLSLVAEERKSWIQDLGFDKLRPDRPTMAQQDFFEICLNPQTALQYYQYHGLEWARQNLVSQARPKNKDGRWIVDYDGFQFELGMIRINWSLSDKRLTQAFKQWLQKNRPAGVKALETRGATQILETLKYLSAMRLLAVMTATQAIAHTENILRNPLYYAESEWYEAQTKAHIAMQQISSPFLSLE